MDFNPIMTPGMNIPMLTDRNSVSLADFVKKHHAGIMEQLIQYGMVLFRGFPCHDASRFSEVIDACNLGVRCTTEDYAIARTLLDNNIYTSSDLAPHIPLPMHHEKPRTRNPPEHIYFCCITPAENGGATLFANAGNIWLDIPATIQEKIREHGVVYQQFFHGKSARQWILKSILNSHDVRCWKDYFYTDKKSQVEERLAAGKLRWQWLNHDNDLKVSNCLPGVITHPVTRKPLWFNSAAYLNYYCSLSDKKWGISNLAQRFLIARDRLPLVCHYGDGRAFSAVEIQAINQAIERHTYPLYWQKGDVMIVDNLTFMHGKESHSGDRLLYSCMTMSKGISRL